MAKTVEKIEKILPKKRIMITSISLIVIVLALGWIACSASNKKHNEYKQREAAFQESLADSLKFYENNLDHYYTDGNYVGIYVKTDLWQKADKANQEQFINEVYALVRMDGINSGLLDDRYIVLTFYTSDKKQIAQYNINK